jgi:hypothetical protein
LEWLRLRTKKRGGKEVELPAYTATQNFLPLSGRVLETLLRAQR